MLEKPTKDAREMIIESLLHYCEELQAQRVVYKKLLADHMRGPDLQDLFDGEIQETRQRLEPAFHTLWAYLRERDWQGLRNTVQQDLDRIEAGKG
jgi:hypothetical protein